MTSPPSLPDRIAAAIDFAESVARKAPGQGSARWLARQVLRAAAVDRQVLHRHRDHDCPNLADLAVAYGVAP